MLVSSKSSANAIDHTQRRIVVVASGAITVQAFLVPMIDTLERRGWKPIIACRDAGTLASTCPNASLVDVPFERRLRPLAVLRSVLVLWRLFRDVRPDSVHAHTPTAVITSIPVAAFARVPVRIATIHGFVHESRKRSARWALKLLELAPLNLATICHTVSPHLTGILQESSLLRRDLRDNIVAFGRGSFSGLAQQHTEGLASLPGRVNPSARRVLGLGPSEPVVAFVGRINVEKGIFELISAMERLLPDFPKACLLLAGSIDGADPKGLRQDLFDDKPWVRQVGWVDDTGQVYGAADVVCVPSHREGFGMVAIEAQAYGVPVVASNVGGLPDAVTDGEGGVLVPPRNINALADALRRVLQDDELRVRLGRGGQGRVRASFLQEDILPGLLEALFPAPTKTPDL